MSSDKDPKGTCGTGYEGIMWGECEQNYSRTGDFKCSKCPSLGLNIFIAIVLFISLFTFVILVISFTLAASNKNKFKLNVLMRMMLNHFQMMVVTVSFDLNWPSSIEQMLSSVKPVASISTQFISFDCFIDQRSSDGSGDNKIPLLFTRVIIIFVFPFILMGASFLFWYFKDLVSERKERKREKERKLREYKEKREHSEGNAKETEEKEEEIGRNKRSNESTAGNTTSSIVLLFLIHPSIVEVMFDMFNCDEIDGVNRLVKDLDTKWYEGLHLYFTLGLAIPGIIIWGFGIPIGTFFMLYKNKSKLDTEKVSKELGFLYNGYTFKAYYWEEYIMIRKMIVIFWATFLATQGKLYQTLVVMFLLAIFLSLQALVKPFHLASFNRLETFSLLASFITMYGGYYFLAEEITSNEDKFDMPKGYKFVFFLAILFFQGLFLFTWLWQFHLEIKRFVENKSKKFYHKIYLCNNPKKIEKDAEKRKRRDKAEEIEIALNSIIDDYDFLIDTNSSGQMKNEKHFEYFVTTSLSKLRSFGDIKFGGKIKEEEFENTFTTKKNMNTSKIAPINDAMNAMKVDFELMNDVSIPTPPLKISSDNNKKKKAFIASKNEIFKGLFKVRKAPKKRYLANEIDTENNPGYALQKFCQTHLAKRQQQKKNDTVSSMNSFEEEDRRERVTKLVKFIKSFGEKSLQQKRTQKNMMKQKPRETKTPSLQKDSFYKQQEINKLIDEEEKHMSLSKPEYFIQNNNGMGISTYKTSSYLKEFQSPDASAVDLDNTIHPFDLTDRDYKVKEKDYPSNTTNNNLFNEENKMDVTNDDIIDGGFVNMDEDEY